MVSFLDDSDSLAQIMPYKETYVFDKQINHPKQFRTDRLKTIRLAAARLTRAVATARVI